MQNSTSDIRRLIDLFMEGETSLEQERTLYAYFASNDVLPELEEFRRMFQGFASLDQSADKEKDAPAVERKRVPLPKVAMYAAASVALIAGLFIIAERYEQRQLESLYGGSYMIVNGKRIDDLQALKPEIDRILAYAEQLEQSASISANLQMIEESLIINE